jgi:hypothetical protein
VHQRRVECGRHADGLREYRGHAGARDTVQSLIPPVVARHMQSRDARRDISQLRGFLFQRHARDQTVDALLDLNLRAGEVERLVGGLLCRCDPAGGQATDGEHWMQ